jgi:hypothetical protein
MSSFQDKFTLRRAGVGVEKGGIKIFLDMVFLYANCWLSGDGSGRGSEQRHRMGRGDSRNPLQSITNAMGFAIALSIRAGICILDKKFTLLLAGVGKVN